MGPCASEISNTGQALLRTGAAPCYRWRVCFGWTTTQVPLGAARTHGNGSEGDARLASTTPKWESFVFGNVIHSFAITPAGSKWIWYHTGNNVVQYRYDYCEHTLLQGSPYSISFFFFRYLLLHLCLQIVYSLSCFFNVWSVSTFTLQMWKKKVNEWVNGIHYKNSMFPGL